MLDTKHIEVGQIWISATGKKIIVKKVHKERVTFSGCAEYRCDKTCNAWEFQGRYSMFAMAAIYGNPEPVVITRIHGANTIDVKRLSDGKYFRLSGIKSA